MSRRKLGMPLASVKATKVKRVELQRIVIENLARHLHDSWTLGPEQRGPDRPPRIDLGQRETIGRKLEKISRGNGFDALRRGPVR